MTASPQLSARKPDVVTVGAACDSMKATAAPTIVTERDLPTSRAASAAVGRTSVWRRIEVALAALLYRTRVNSTPRTSPPRSTYPPLNTIFESSRLERESHRL